MAQGDAVENWPGDALAVLARLPDAVLLHSGRLDPPWSRRCVIAVPDGAYRWTWEDRGQWIGNDPPPVSGELFADLDRLADDAACLYVGYLGYDAGRLIEDLPVVAAADRDWPVAQWQRCRGWAVLDLESRTWTAHGTWAHRPPRLTAPVDVSFEAGPPEPAIAPEAHRTAVRRVLQYIAAGDVFEVNLAQRFTAPFLGSPVGLFTALAARSPAWYGACLRLIAHPGDPQRCLCSTSPELFLRLDAAGHVVTRPIKGTRSAAASAAELRDSVKDQAELNMVVDMLRNDLGRVSRYGSVQVPQPRVIESHPTVHHGVATIEADLRPGRGVGDLLRATFPGGSITGAPKVRAMQIIEQLEPVRRGPYCGAIGMIHGPTAELNIAIRTLLIEQHAPGGAGRADFSVGGGIVADSDPQEEYQETLAKAAAMQAALSAEGGR
jgi:para-aminobenzoate synthetase component 1